jgi:hypothetical protein
MSGMNQPLRLLFLAALLLLLGACSRATPIKDVTERPRDFAGKTVTLEGEVKQALSLFVVRYFMLNDGTGEIAVVTERPLPKVGERLKVTGTVKEAFSLGDKTTVVLSEDPPKAK